MPPPPTAIVSDPEAIKAFLVAQGIAFSDVWIPVSEDILGLDLAVAAYLRRQLRDSVSRAETAHCQFILDNLLQYSREFGGFMQDNRKFLVCNMQCAQAAGPGGAVQQFTVVKDGGANVVLVVLDQTVKRVVKLEWHAEA